LINPSAIAMALMLVCAGFFSIHLGRGSFNRNLTGAAGRANSCMSWLTTWEGPGITLSAVACGLADWQGAALGLVMLTVPLITGLREMRSLPTGLPGKVDTAPDSR
jgi:hypothetical protein